MTTDMTPTEDGHDDTGAGRAVEHQAENARLMSKARIMMVDDEPLNMEVLQVHLEAEGYQHFVRHVDSASAMAAIRVERPDVLLLDLVMPEVTGFDILGEMRADKDLKHVPVVVLTSSDDSATKHRALTLGATDFLAKPVDASELALRLRNTLAAQAYQKRMMHFDGLTDLPNARLFTGMVRRSLHAIEFSNRSAELVLINIQRFKAVNDSFGTEQGDNLLFEFSQRLQSAFGCMDYDAPTLDEDGLRRPLVARLGGDRFGALLRGPDLGSETPESGTTPDGGGEGLTADRYLARLVEILQMPFVVDGDDVYLNITAGVSLMTQHTRSVETLINEAETAMLYSRDLHDGSFCHYSDRMDARARELLSLENGMRTAIDNGEMYLVFQPKVDVTSGEIGGAEALLRWEHPQLGPVSPVQFIPIAEDNGAIVTIGEWVMRESCVQAARWRAAGYPEFRLSVNVSIRQLIMKTFPDRVRAILDESGLPAQNLVIELTENMIMEEAEANIARLDELKRIGVQLSIDDFGTGYSSLSYLQKFPIDQLKIDRSFIMEIESERDPVPIVKAVISLAHDLEMNVVAEGVETPAQLAHLQALNCEEYQGYLFSRPVRVDEFDTLLAGSALQKSA